MASRRRGPNTGAQRRHDRQHSRHFRERLGREVFEAMTRDEFGTGADGWDYFGHYRPIGKTVTGRFIPTSPAFMEVPTKYIDSMTAFWNRVVDSYFSPVPVSASNTKKSPV